MQAQWEALSPQLAPEMNTFSYVCAGGPFPNNLIGETIYPVHKVVVAQWTMWENSLGL